MHHHHSASFPSLQGHLGSLGSAIFVSPFMLYSSGIELDLLGFGLVKSMANTSLQMFCCFAGDFPLNT